MFDPSDSKQAQLEGDSRSELPNRRDGEVTAFVDRLLASGPDAVAEAIAGVSKMGQHVLTSYAGRMASLAVRRQDEAVLLKAVVADVVGGLHEDRRENLMVMAPIEDAALRIGLDLAELFGEASAVVGEPGADSLMRWLSRKPEDRALRVMGYITTEEPSGFLYKRTLS